MSSPYLLATRTIAKRLSSRLCNLEDTCTPGFRRYDGAPDRLNLNAFLVVRLVLAGGYGFR